MVYCHCGSIVRRILAGLLVGCVMLLMLLSCTIPVMASDPVITITVTPNVVVTGLTATYISDYEVGLHWQMGADAKNVMVRAKWGSLPANMDDGFLVYYGNATSYIHYTSLATAAQPVYYRMWTQDAGGSWHDPNVSAGGDFMSRTMLFIVVAILALGLSLGYTAKRQGFLAYGAAAFWLFLGLLGYESSTSVSPLEFSDVYMGLFWICMGMVVTFVLLPTMTRERVTGEEIEEEWEGEDLEPFGYGRSYRTNRERSEERMPRPRRSRFNESGVI